MSSVVYPVIIKFDPSNVPYPYNLSVFFRNSLFPSARKNLA